MTDYDKVVKGVLQCIMDINDDGYDTQCYDCPYYSEDIKVSECKKDLTDDFLIFAKSSHPVKPVKTCKSSSSLGVNGILIVGSCPVCGQIWINNHDNKFCGGCGRRLIWDA